MTAPQLAPGTVVAGKYSIVAPLGFGGSSSTYHAVASDGREVALKIFDPAIRQRADIMSAIEQTYAATNALPTDVVVPLLDAGYDQTTGAPFSVTERIPYPSLAQLVAQRPLTPEELSTLLGYMTRALDASHQMQLCHHALKPTNIFVGFAHGYGVRITDFGAGLARAAVPTQEGYTQSAPWLAPEQVQGTVPAGPSADVFATALIAFFALTGRLYWQSCQGAMDLNSWQRELMSPRTAPSARARELGVALNPSFDAVLGAAISVDPNQRYRTVGELAAAFDSLVAAKGPETAATMAFPAMNLPGAGEYPPPPVPTGGLGMSPPGAGGAYPANAEPVQAQQMGMGHENAGMSGAYPASAPTDVPPPRPTDYVVRPGEAGAPRRASSNKLVPIIVGVAALVLIGGGAAAFMLMGNKQEGDAGTELAANASATVPTPSADPAAPPNAEASAAAPTTTEPAASAATPPPPAEQEVKLTCAPVTCGEVKVDDQVVDLSKPLMLTPGEHTVVVTRAGYEELTEKITVADAKLAKNFTLTPVKTASTPAPKAPTGGGTGFKTVPTASKPCGKFLKKNCK